MFSLSAQLPPPPPAKTGWPWTVASAPSSGFLGGHEWPKITVVTPSLNQGRYIESTILSVLNQGYPNLEYIIIDGGSTDNSLEIIDKYDSYIHYWCSEPDNGQYHAINKGFNHADGDIYCWLNSDDMFCPWALFTVAVIFMQLPEVRWVTTIHKMLWDANGFCMRVDSIPGYSKEAFFDGRYLPHRRRSFGWIQQESTFWRGDLWKEVGGLNVEYSLAADFDLWTRFFRHAELYGVATPLGGFRVHEKQRTYDGTRYVAEAEEILCKIQEEMKIKSKSSEILAILCAKYKKISQIDRLYQVIAGKKYRVNNIASNNLGVFYINSYDVRCITRFI